MSTNTQLSCIPGISLGNALVNPHDMLWEVEILGLQSMDDQISVHVTKVESVDAFGTVQNPFHQRVIDWAGGPEQLLGRITCTVPGHNGNKYQLWCKK